MDTLAVAVLMLACALSTASVMLQVITHPTQRLPYIDTSSASFTRGSTWLFCGAAVLIVVGSFLHSQATGADPFVEFVIFLFIGVCPVILIRMLHNRRVAHPESPTSV